VLSSKREAFRIAEDFDRNNSHAGSCNYRSQTASARDSGLAARFRNASLAPAPPDDVSTWDAVMPYYTAIVTLLAVAFYFFLATRVAVAHGKFDVKLPATTGNPDFERVFRT
jgi:hypothetical protein